MPPLKLTIMCDNETESGKNFHPDSGFAVLIEVDKRMFLFDTCTRADTLVHNMREAGFAPSDPEAVILSHNHFDHTDGVPAILSANPDIPVYVHKNWKSSAAFRGFQIPDKNLQIIEKPGPQPGLPESMYFTGTLASSDYGGVEEHALFFQLENSLLLLTGCCHPGLTAFLQNREQLGLSETMPLHVIGGFHGFSFSRREATALSKQILSITCCHCTRYKSRFSKQFPNQYQEGYAGWQRTFQ